MSFLSSSPDLCKLTYIVRDLPETSGTSKSELIEGSVFSGHLQYFYRRSNPLLFFYSFFVSHMYVGIPMHSLILT